MKDIDPTGLPIRGGSATITAKSNFVRTTEERVYMSGSGPAANAARRILVVEDEMLIGMLLEDMLTDMGHSVVGIIPRVNEALTAAKQEAFDLAILDVHLHGQAVFPVAEALIERGIPFVFATGYGERGLPEQYRSRPILQKPFAKDDLERTLATVKVELGS